ncbi:uncharacterized protein BBA_09824 [Beauveria bassiana ARSEF 2860]|uniref:Uncharacterized protein n=1 Tax=Beauveria bassiana (strain ARSEF 2860) TaxID=655819 RepID=J5JB46_BEAB2|nr:uncharacterized protein BBA_09824 [Beauveria bassiana ARSEF 2860]EJP61206.1 hypothetical protein BBA_09824 [Beauveria bassiana ARSEF 2860]
MRSTQAKLSLLRSFIGFSVFVKLLFTGLGIDNAITTSKNTSFQASGRRRFMDTSAP